MHRRYLEIGFLILLAALGAWFWAQPSKITINGVALGLTSDQLPFDSESRSGLYFQNGKTIRVEFDERRTVRMVDGFQLEVNGQPIAAGEILNTLGPPAHSTDAELKAPSDSRVRTTWKYPQHRLIIFFESESVRFRLFTPRS